MEEGYNKVLQYYPKAHIYRYNDSLLVTEAVPLVNYVKSTSSKNLSNSKIKEFTKFIEFKLSKSESIHITKDMGIIIAEK